MKSAKEVLRELFNEILPGYGMNLRVKQKELALEMLAALQEKKLALCEAEVGTGKTHAYLLALVVYRIYSAKKAPVVISTSTIALQKALTEEYIPQISEILLACGMINRPLSFVVRKGKNHYICDNRLAIYEASMKALDRERDTELIIELSRFRKEEERGIDLDDSFLTPYVKARINVCHCNRTCPCFDLCRFMQFKKACLTKHYDFQITNHNYVLADLLGQKQGKKPLFPSYGALILDEAHKLIDAARQMYSTRWQEKEVEQILQFSETGNSGERNTPLRMLRKQLAEGNRQIFFGLAGEIADCHTREGHREEVVMGIKEKRYLKQMIKDLEQLAVSFPGEKRLAGRGRRLKQLCQELMNKLNVFLNSSQFICWVEKSERGSLILCAIPIRLENFFVQDIWSRPIPIIFTSGTMSVRGDFAYFKQQLGLQAVSPGRIRETSKPSPFAYESNGLLYIPERMPFPHIRDEDYIQAIMEEIQKLVNITHGHTLILFTSYWLMERVFYGLKEQLFPYPLFLMGRGRLDKINQFRHSGNGVLFASDSAGEGIDLPGDILSSLIMVKLPFPVPDPVMEYRKKEYLEAVEDEKEAFMLYRKEMIVPQMLVKLRQWFGRGIRREEDTAVFTILDSRASLKGRYRREILDTLPTMPVTDRLEDVEKFIREKKTERYFRDKEEK